MTDAPNSFETVERPQKGDKSGFHEFVNTPDFHHSVNPEMAEFIWKANAVLSQFRKTWQGEHADSWTRDLELDLVPIWSAGMVSGYLGVSEIDGESYDYYPAKTIKMNGAEQ